MTLGIAACGGGSTTTVTETETTPTATGAAAPSSASPGGDTAEIQGVYSRYFDELRAGEGQTACDLLTSAYQDKVVQEAGGGDCPTAVSSYAGLYNDYRPELQAIEVSGDAASATDPGDKRQNFSPQEVEFERVDDSWLIADAG